MPSAASSSAASQAIATSEPVAISVTWRFAWPARGSDSRRAPSCSSRSAPSRSAGRFCRVRHSTEGVRSCFSAHSHASAVSTASAGRNTRRLGMARSAERCSTGWCVGPSSPRPIESCVITWTTRMPISAASRIAGRRIVGEGEERAAIGDEPAVQRDAVHRRRHGMLAHAVMDVAAGEIVRRDRPSAP